MRQEAASRDTGGQGTFLHQQSPLSQACNLEKSLQVSSWNAKASDNTQQVSQYPKHRDPQEVLCKAEAGQGMCVSKLTLAVLLSKR